MKNLIKVYWKENLLIFVLMLGAGISTTLVSFINAMILNSLISMNFNGFIQNIIKLIAVFSLFLIFTYFHIKKTAETIQKKSTYLRFLVISKLKNLNTSDFASKNQGVYVSWLSNDISQIEQAGLVRVYELLMNTINLLLALIALAYIHWSLLLLTMMEILIIVNLPKIFGKKLQAEALNVASTNEGAVDKSTNLLSGFSTFHLYRNLSYLISELKKQFATLAQAKNKQSFLMAKVAIIGGLGNVIGQISAYTLSGYLVVLGKITVGMITATASLSSNIFNTVGNLSQYLASIQSVEPIIRKLVDFSAENSQDQNQTADNLSSSQSGIAFQNVSFGYDQQNPIIRELNYCFKLNKKYGITGPSGSGKSTILNMLIKNISPTKGRILMGQDDLQNVSQDAILSKITIIEQKPYVFNGTIKENICLGDSFTDAEILAVLKAVDLPAYGQNLNLTVTENGTNFSGGQRQRLALARGLIRNKKILLLDESTSGLDKQTALKIESLILAIPDITVIMISHHLDESIKQKLDDILVLS